MSENELWVNTRFRNEDKTEFEAVKEYLGIKTSSDVIRFLVHQQAREIEQPRVLVDTRSDYRPGSFITAQVPDGGR